MSVSILVVDDEADVAELFRQQFRREVRQGHYVIHFARSAEEALEKLDDGIKAPARRRAVRYQHAEHGWPRSAARDQATLAWTCRS
jgi:hypothetical protein